MWINELNQEKNLPKELVINRKAEFWRIMHKINQNSSEKIAKNMEDKEKFLWYIKDDFESGKEIFIPAKDEKEDTNT